MILETSWVAASCADDPAPSGSAASPEQAARPIDSDAAVIPTATFLAKCFGRYGSGAAPEVRVVSPFPEWFDVLPAGVSKADGLEVLLEALGVGLDEVAVFGDAENDLTIMRKVPHSVAVANATDEVLRAARHRVGASADEGVADALFEIARATRAGEQPAFLREETL